MAEARFGSYTPGVLVLDIGNSETTWGRIAGAERSYRRLPTEARATSDLLRAVVGPLLAPPRAGEEARVASVVPSLTPAWVEFLTGTGWSVRVVSGVEVPIALKGPSPEEVGVDRLLAAWGARERFGSPVIVADFGTATTFDAVDANGAYVGGAIAPGLAIGADALARRAARLVRVELEPPEGPIGTTTRAALQSGLLHGHAAAAEGMIARFRARLGAETPVVATGGHAGLVARCTEVFDHLVPHLVLDALSDLPAR